MTTIDPVAQGRRNALNGTRFERRAQDEMETDGYYVARSAGSHGPADLVGLKPAQVLLVQCKRGGMGRLAPAEWDELYDTAVWLGALAILAVPGPNGRGIVYLRLLGHKWRGRRSQPVEPFYLDAVAAHDEAG